MTRTGDAEFVVDAGDDLDLCGVVCLLEAQLVDVQEFGWTEKLGRQCNGQRATGEKEGSRYGRYVFLVEQRGMANDVQLKKKMIARE